MPNRSIEAESWCPRCRSKVWTLYREDIGGGHYRHVCDVPIPLYCEDCGGVIERRAAQ